MAVHPLVHHRTLLAGVYSHLICLGAHLWHLLSALVHSALPKKKKRKAMLPVQFCLVILSYKSFPTFTCILTSSTSAVPNLFGTRDWFRGRQFSHGWGGKVVMDGSGTNASDGARQRKLRWLARRSPPAVRPGS